MNTKMFFCAECSAKFDSTYTDVVGHYGQHYISSDIDACPKCGSREIYPDDAEGHHDEMTNALDYEDALLAAELDEEGL